MDARQPGTAAQRRIVVSGASGLLGSALCRALGEDGVDVVRLSRSRRGPGWAHWDPDAGVLDPSVLDGAQAVVHLAGAGIADARWTEARKRVLLESRTRSAELLCRALATCERRPEVLVSASGSNYYGNQGETWLTEDSPPGDTFLARVCVAWEQAAEQASGLGLRVAYTRFGLVMTPEGGGLAKMLPAFRAGVGGRLGSGRQYTPWIARDDAIQVLRLCLDRPELRGPVNAVAPQAVTNAELTKTLAAVLRRPAVVPVPAVALKALFGQMGEELLLHSMRLEPQVLERTGYTFRFPELRPALEHLLR